ncbi:uncharacterized protein TM35_000132160 [Trypanosoma theileri]|uniref:Uncharacterized protein n=1 Tax=Trypanosoma theileri TaxID=67003 RepID=A0A1X0NX07_9TRYP|nr:uncharacterized protein TM35_000132160 [Trypanosoma theileri]ORC89212.1 hypothetical protein TM35_000132160 [Trypanosoma theileri]
MLGELPPIVVLPSNPADSLRPVPLFVRCTGLYEICPGSSHIIPSHIDTPHIHTVQTTSDSLQTQRSQLNVANKRDEKTVPPPLPSANVSEEKNTDKSNDASTGDKLDALTEKEVEVLLQVLEERFKKYSVVKQQTSEQYLTRIETDVDRFLTSNYGGGSSRFSSGVASFIKSTIMARLPSPPPGNRGETQEKNSTKEITQNESSSNNNGGGNNGSYDLPTLQESVYRANCIPFNYLDVRPENMRAIGENLVVLRHCLEEYFRPGSTLRKSLLGPVLRAVWSQSLTPLENSASELLQVAQQNVWPPLNHFIRREQQHGDSVQWNERRARYDRIVKALQDDLNYLHTIYKMDETAATTLPVSMQQEGAPEGLSDYVPVSGLVLSRLHRLENEHRTVWDFWRSR